jgi:hypothetical protein
LLQLKWWTDLYKAIKATSHLSENGDEMRSDTDHQAEAEDFFLQRFRNFMNNKNVSKILIGGGAENILMRKLPLVEYALILEL